MAGLDGLGKDDLRNVIQIKNAIRDVKSDITATNKELSKFGSSVVDIGAEMGKVTKATSQFADLQDEAARSASATNKAIKKQSEQQAIVRTLNIQINELMARSLTVSDDQAKVLQKQAQQIGAVRDGASDLSKEFGKIAESSADMDKKTMWFTAFSDFTKDIPGLKTLSGPFQAAAKASRETVINNAKAKDIQGRIGKLTGKQLKSGEGLTKAKLKSLKLEDITQGKTGSAAAKMLKNAKKQNVVQSVGRKGMSAGFKALGPAISKAFAPIAIITTVVSIIKGIVAMMAEASKETAAFSKNLLISRQAARDLRDTVIQEVGLYNAINTSLGYQEITRKDMLKAMDAINQKLGFQVNILGDFGDEMGANVAESALLVKNFGFSADAAASLFMESVKMGKPLKEMTKEIMGQLAFQGTQDGIMVDMVKTIERATKISGNLRANFGDNVGAIANAVYQADKLGLSLEGMEGASSNLLDFQSSIENEMKAELLLGRNLNLEKAREYALMGQTGKLMKEISKQAGTQKDFLAMNIPQRKALAKAVGLEVNELADMFSKQKKMDALRKKNLEVQNKLKKAGVNLEYDKNGAITSGLQEIRIAQEAAGKSEAQIREILGEQVYLRKQEEDATQKFNDALAQAKDIFASFVTGGLLDKLAAGLEGLINSSIFQGFIEEDAAEDRIESTEKVLEQQKKSGEKLTKSQEDLANENVRLAKESIALNAQSGIKDDITDVGKAALSGAAIGAGLTAWLGPGAGIGAAIGGLIGGGIALYKNSQDQAEADTARLASVESNKNFNESMDTADDFIIRPGQRPLKYNRDDVIVGGTNLGGGGGGNTEAILGRILAAIENGGDVYMDGDKVGKSLALATSRMG